VEAEIRKFGKILIGLGVFGFVAATAWWLLFFEPLLGVSVKDASACFYQTTVECEVGNLVGQIGDVPPYSPASLWISSVVFIVGILTYGLTARRK